VVFERNVPATQVAAEPATKTTTRSGVDRLPTGLPYDDVFPAEVETERLLLRQWHEEDAEPLAEIYRQPEYLETMPALDLEGTRAQVSRFMRSWETDGYSQWAACDSASARLIGRVGVLCHHDWPLVDGPVPEVGWVLHRDFWGRGLATEGGRAGVDAWRGHLPDEPLLYSFTTANNVRSRAVMARLGFTEQGTAVWHGYDILWHSLTR
jgi:RimJ/RimL family protein N-acetyltransferase